MADINELQFFRIVDPRGLVFLPRFRHLIEQIKDINTDRFYDYIINIVMNPAVWLVLLHDKENIIKGFLWANVDILEEQIYIRAFSVDREYQSLNGEIEKKAVKYLFDLPIDERFKKKIVMSTTRAKACEKFGWKRSEKVLMEIENDKPDEDVPTGQ